MSMLTGMQMRPRPAPAACRARSRSVSSVRASAYYRTPSSFPAATELEALGQLSILVPDTLLGQSKVRARAGTTSAGVLKGIVGAERFGIRTPAENAVAAALAYDQCSRLKGDERVSCQLDKALVNVGAIQAGEVDGRVCTEIDPRLAYDTAQLVSKGQRLLRLYEEMGVPRDKLIFRLPGTWQGIQAARRLEEEGAACQVILVYSLVQGIAAAQAGVSVVQANVGRTRDWFARHPKVVRDVHSPRGQLSSQPDPGLHLVRQLYTYAKKFHPKTQVMASGLRTKGDALALAGCDYLVLPEGVMDALEQAPTMSGYNDGLHACEGSCGMEAELSPELAREDPMAEEDTVTEALFKERLGVAAEELLQGGLASLVGDVGSVLPYFATMTKGQGA